MTAKKVGSGTMDVLSTPKLSAYMEKCAWQSVAAELKEGESTVGTAIELVHTSPTPVGMKVRCESELRSIDGKNLTFMITALDKAGEIARAKHERCIVTNENFLIKTAMKLKT